LTLYLPLKITKLNKWEMVTLWWRPK